MNNQKVSLFRIIGNTIGNLGLKTASNHIDDFARWAQEAEMLIGSKNSYKHYECEIEIRSKFLGTYTGQVNYTDGTVFTDFTENPVVEAAPNNIEQFFINNFEDLTIPASERFTLNAKVRPIDQNANSFEIIGEYTKDYILNGTLFRVRYSGASLGTVSLNSGRIVIEYKLYQI